MCRTRAIHPRHATTARGGKGSAFPPLTASVRTGKGIGLRSAEPRSRSVWQALYPLSDCFSSGCFSECLSECLRNGCGASRAAKAAWARQGGGCEMRQGTVRCGSRRRDRYGEFVRGSTRGIGAANRSCESAQTTDAKEIAKRITPVECTGIGAEICAGYWCRELRGNLRQEFASGICVRRLALKFAGGGDCPVDGAVGLKREKAGTGTKKDREKNRGHTGGVEFSRGGFGCHPYRQDKTVVVLSPIAGPEISLIASSGSRNGLYGKLRLWFRLRVTTSLVRSALRLLVSTPSGCPGFGPGFQPPWIRSAPGLGIIRRAAPARARRHRLPGSRPAAWRRTPRTRSRAPAAPRRPS